MVEVVSYFGQLYGNAEKSKDNELMNYKSYDNNPNCKNADGPVAQYACLSNINPYEEEGQNPLIAQTSIFETWSPFEKADLRLKN